MAEDKILTLHPQGKTGRRIDKSTYDLFRQAIVSILSAHDGLTHYQLFERLDSKLKGKFSGNIGWYGETLKLDLEARGRIRRSDDKPATYHLVKP